MVSKHGNPCQFLRAVNQPQPYDSNRQDFAIVLQRFEAERAWPILGATFPNRSQCKPQQKAPLRKRPVMPVIVINNLKRSGSKTIRLPSSFNYTASKGPPIIKPPMASNHKAPKGLNISSKRMSSIINSNSSSQFPMFEPSWSFFVLFLSAYSR